MEKNDRKTSDQAEFIFLCGKHQAVSIILRMATIFAFTTIIILWTLPVLQYAEASATMFDVSLKDTWKAFTKTNLFQTLLDAEFLSAMLVIILSVYSHRVAHQLCEVNDDFCRKLSEELDKHKLFRWFPFLK